MDRHKVFNTCSKHLLTQWAKSQANPNEEADPICMYRGTDGNKCALGVLIPDKLYTEAFENRVPKLEDGDALDSMAQRTLASIMGASTYDDCLFLREIQQIHDMYPVDLWPVKIATFALKHELKLDITVINLIESRAWEVRKMENPDG